MNYNIKFFDTFYPLTYTDILKSSLLRRLIEDHPSIKNSTLLDLDDEFKEISFIFIKDKWEWIYSQLIDSNSQVVMSTMALESINITDFLGIDDIINNIIKNIDKDAFLPLDLFINYENIYKCQNVRVVVHLYLIKKFKSINNIVRYLGTLLNPPSPKNYKSSFSPRNSPVTIPRSDSPQNYFSKEVENIPNDIQNTIDLFESSSFRKSIELQKSVFSNLIKSFILFPFQSTHPSTHHSNTGKGKGMGKVIYNFTIPIMVFDKVGELIIFKDFKLLYDIIPKQLFTINNWDNYLEVIIFDETMNFNKLNYFDSETFIYKFSDPLSGKKYLLIPFSLTGNIKYLTLHSGEFYPRIDDNDTIEDYSDERLKKIGILSNITESRFVDDGSNMFFIENDISYTYRNDQEYILGNIIF